ncbi:hypothetical protein LZ495_25965 [Yinghuangia sp. KLBMP8922]|uniref:Uncharacterized protein n=1 Tax=Yinghuangia soli TaxID=2908204 RepID=A0AA41Q4P9_9ACTN|nr:hypothetical protein [Yinghuangia soli]MCF2530646.1 hypothetical protein [Yinghuangia soli]
MRKQACSGEPQRGQDKDQETEHRGGGDRHFGQQVARDGHQADPLGERHHDRTAHRLRGAGQRDDDGELRRATAPDQRVRPMRSQQQQGPGGQNGQDEPEAPRQARVDEHQEQRGGRQCGRPVPAAAAEQRGQRHQPHERRPQHARLRPREHDEPQHDAGPEDGQCATTGSGVPERQEGGAEQDRHVGTAHGHEVGQLGGPEVLHEFGRHCAGVADDEPWQQTAFGRRQSGAGGPHPRPEMARPTLVRGRAVQDPGRRLGDEERRVAAARPRGDEPPSCCDPGRRQQAQPRTGVRDAGGQHDDRRADARGRVKGACVDRLDTAGQAYRTGPAGHAPDLGGDRDRVPGHGEVQGDERLLRGK